MLPNLKRRMREEAKMFFSLSLKNCLLSTDHGISLLLLFLIFEFLTFVKIFFFFFVKHITFQREKFYLLIFLTVRNQRNLNFQCSSLRQWFSSLLLTEAFLGLELPGTHEASINVLNLLKIFILLLWEIPEMCIFSQVTLLRSRTHRR